MVFLCGSRFSISSFFVHEQQTQREKHARACTCTFTQTHTDSHTHTYTRTHLWMYVCMRASIHSAYAQSIFTSRDKCIWQHATAESFYADMPTPHGECSHVFLIAVQSLLSLFDREPLMIDRTRSISTSSRWSTRSTMSAKPSANSRKSRSWHALVSCFLLLCWCSVLFRM
jgi:hypothetical protein